MDSVKMFGIATRGVNVVSAPTEIGLEEVTSAQNGEVVTDAGMSALDKRPGMSRINANPIGGAVLLAKDVPADVLFARTPTLYAGMYTGSTHNWRKSTDGTTWTNDDTPAKPFSNNALITGFFKRFPKCASVGRKMYYADGTTPIGIHSWDGTTDATVATVPPAVAGVTIATPPDPTVTYEFDTSGATTYSYKVVPVVGASHGAASAAISVTCKATLDSNNFNVITPASPPVAGATTYDVYRTAGGATQGKIGTIPVVAGAFTTGNGSGLTGATFQTGSGSLVRPSNTPDNGVTYTYVVVIYSGSNHSGNLSVTSTHGPTTLAATGDSVSRGPLYVGLVTPPYGTDTIKVWRTVGGSSQGLIYSGVAGGILTISGCVDSGLAGDGTSPPGSVVGLGGSSAYTFTDAAVVGDASTAPSTASGAASADAVGVMDLITDGTDLYLAILDNATADPVVYGRVLKYSIGAGTWTQIGAGYPQAAGNGGPSALAFYDGALVTGTFAGITAGNTTYLQGLGTPLPAGGFPEVHTTAVSQVPCCLAVFNGELFAGYAFLAAGTAAVIARRVPIATWSAITGFGVGTAAKNAWTTLGVFNGRLYAGWTSGDGLSAAGIFSTADGANWTTELTCDAAEVPCQMVVFNSYLYVVLGRTGIAYNTKSRIVRRSTVGTWTAVDDPSDDFAGCLGVVYV